MSTPLPESVLGRYASPEMSAVFSQERRILLWRDLWIALAEAEHQLGLPITKAQVDELKRKRNKINWEMVAKKEKEIRHDVMAHVHAYGSECKKAAGIIHLGATSAYVTDNADLILIREGLGIIAGKVAAVIDRLGKFAQKEKSTPTIAYTHFQPAQPTTVGKRACLWAQDFVFDLESLEFTLEKMLFHGVKGATGTQDSFLKLFEGNRKKVVQLDKMVTKMMGFKKAFLATGQTYPRKVDTRVISVLAGIAESASKFGNDIRLLQALHELEEPRELNQVGSSAMPYKRNPIRAERIVSLGRYVINLLSNCYQTSANQWFERSLDDSANRRLVIPHSFLICDAVLDLVINVVSGLSVEQGVRSKRLAEELPFLQTEEILMEAVRAGGDRQKLHERIRKHSTEVVKEVREKGNANELLARLRKDPAFSEVPPINMVRKEPSQFVGLAPDQVDDFTKAIIAPIRKKYSKFLKHKPEISV